MQRPSELFSNQTWLESSLRVSLDSAFDPQRMNGLNALSGSLELLFSQKMTGGFERFQLKVDASAQDADGGDLLSLSQHMVLDLQSEANTAEAQMDFKASVPDPQRFMPELAQFGALKVDAQAAVDLSGLTLTLSEADLDVIAAARPVVALELKKALSLKGRQNLEGELLELSLMNVPMAWLSPWMPAGLVLSAQPLSMNLSVLGESDGAMVVEFKGPVQLSRTYSCSRRRAYGRAVEGIGAACYSG